MALAGLTSRPAWLAPVEGWLASLRAEALENPFAFGHALCVADAWLDGAAILAVVGEREKVRQVLAAAGARWAPTDAVVAHEMGDPVPEILVPTLEGKESRGLEPTTYRCHHFTCEPPRSGLAPESRPA